MKDKELREDVKQLKEALEKSGVIHFATLFDWNPISPYGRAFNIKSDKPESLPILGNIVNDIAFLSKKINRLYEYLGLEEVTIPKREEPEKVILRKKKRHAQQK